MSKELETTYYRFQSEVRAFLSKLLKNPVDAQPSKYLKDREFTRKKLIDELLKRDVIERHEKILDRTNSDEKEAKYVVKFKVHKKDFEKRIHRIYIKFFEKNLNESVEEMRAWHGSGTEFDNFEDVHVNTLGGWGTYVTVDYDLAKSYAFVRGLGGKSYQYEVEIPDDNGHNYLNDGEKRPEVYDRVYQILVKEFPKRERDIRETIDTCRRSESFEPLLNGDSLYDISQRNISLALDKNGIVGYGYDGFGMSMAGMSKCYVIFNAKNVKIVNRTQVAESVEEIEGYHGSPRRFRKFKDRFVRTYRAGWGTYVATNFAEGKKYTGANGYMYEVEVPDDNGSNYIYGNFANDEESKKIYSVLIKAFPDRPTAIANALERSKHQWIGCYTPIFNEEGIEGIPATSKEISKIFAENGYVGVIWKTFGYIVIFDARNIKIVRRTRASEFVNEEAELRSCANVIGVVGGGKPGETADRWAKYVNDNENGFKRQVFANEDDMKKRILNGPDGDVYRKRGGVKLDEEDGGMAAGGDGSGGATSTSSVASETTRGDLGYDVPFKEVQRRGIYVGAQGEKRSTNPILGKTITAEAKKGRRIFITEEQYERILKEEGLGGATTTFSVGSDTTRGDMGYDVPFLGKAKGKSKSKFLKPAMDREPGFSVERMK